MIEEILRKGSLTEAPVFVEGEIEKCTDITLKGKSANPSIDYWHPPVCQNYKSESGTLRSTVSLTKELKKSGGKDQLPHERSLCLQILIRENLFYGKLENWDQITPSNSPRERGTK